MLREFRRAYGRLMFFVICLAIGVAAVVAVAGLSSSLDEGIRSEARRLLAADLVVASHRPLPAELGTALEAFPGAERTDTREFFTMVASPDAEGAPGASQLVGLKVVDGTYPFYGTLRLSPDRPLGELLDSTSTVVAPEVLARLGLRLGERLRIGGEDFLITGKVLSEPDRISFTLALGPRIFLSGEGLERTGLEGFGSRITYRALVKLPGVSTAREVETVAERLTKALPEAGYLRIETYSEAQPRLRNGLKRLSRFLGLVALLSLLIGGIGVAQTVRAWLATRMDSIAILKCLGFRPREVLAVYFGQTILLGLLGSLAGAAAGTLLHTLILQALGEVVPPDLVRSWQPFAILRGFLLGMAVTVLFGFPALAKVLRVPPLRVLRRDAQPLPSQRGLRWGTGCVLLGGIFAIALVQTGSPVLAGQFTGGVVAVVAALALAAQAVIRMVARLPRGFTRVWVRHGLAALARPDAQTMGGIIALGLGVLVVLGMYLVESGLSRQLDTELPKDVPTAFLVDIQPDQWPGVTGLLERAGADRIDSVPVVMARLTAINGRGVQALVAERPDTGREKWVLTREQRLTYMETLPQDNVVVKGAFSKDPDRAEISIEKDFAEDLGIDTGDTLSFNVQGIPLNLTVTSIRTVEWRTFGINFFLVVEPGLLEEAPQNRLAAVHIPPENEQRFQDALAANFPNVTFLKVREILEKIVSVLGRVGLAVRALGGFTVLAGIAILGGAVSASSARRGREVALLKTLGMTTWGIIGVFAVEYALIGLVAGVIGACGAVILAFAVLTKGMDVEWAFRPAPFAATVLGNVLLTVIAGLAASLHALRRPPAEVLRGE